MIARPFLPVAPPRPPRRCARPSRAGFTLIELLVVIGVISLLMALLVPAVFNAVTTANNTAVRTDIGGMEAALSQFHMVYNRMPPSYIDLRRTAASGSTPAKFVTPETMSTLRSLFGTSIDEATMIASLNNMDFPGEDVTGPGDYSKRGVLRGAECLVLFLGGLPASGDFDGTNMIPVTELAGWSKSPIDPFNAQTKSGGGFVLLDRQRRTMPFYMFEPDRLKYVNEVEDAGATPTAAEPLLSYFTYLDALDSQTAPLIYASSDGGRGVSGCAT